MNKIVERGGASSIFQFCIRKFDLIWLNSFPIISQKMSWIIEPNCTILCPIDTRCFRPLQFSEPELFVHITIHNFPDNLLHPVISYYFLLTVLILIIAVVNFLLVVCKNYISGNLNTIQNKQLGSIIWLCIKRGSGGKAIPENQDVKEFESIDLGTRPHITVPPLPVSPPVVQRYRAARASIIV